MEKPVAIITGAGRGIGRAVACKLAESKYRLVLVARSHDQLAETAFICGHGLVAAADVCDEHAVQAVVKQAMKRWGRVDALVNNAGMARMASIDQTPADLWKATIETNLTAAYFFTRAVWPIWRAQGHGVLVNVSSQAARDPFPGMSAYAAAKAGLNGFSLSLAREGAPIGVRVHVVAPGATETSMLRASFSKDQFPADQAMDPAEVADVIVHCVLGDLKYSSGEVIYLRKNAVR